MDFQSQSQRTLKETSNDDREKIINAYIGGNNPKKISEILNLNRSTVYRIIKIYNTENRIIKKQRGGIRNKKLTEEQKNIVRNWVDENCSITLKKLCTKIEDNFNISVSHMTVERCLRDFQYSLKRVHLLPIQRNNENAINQRAEYANEFMHLLSSISESNIIFIDEAGFSISMRSRRGRSKLGSRAVQVVRGLRTRNISLCCAINKTEIIGYQTNESAYNGNSFFQFLENLFIILREKGINQAVFIMDNAAIHKIVLVNNLITTNGHRLLFLPPYSPFLNPIENLFSKWKEIVRDKRVNTENELISEIYQGMRLISSEDCIAYFRHMLGFIRKCINRETIINE